MRRMLLLIVVALIVVAMAVATAAPAFANPPFEVCLKQANAYHNVPKSCPPFAG